MEVFFRTPIQPIRWRLATITTLATLMALSLCWPWLYGAGRAFWYLDYLNTLALAALAGATCWWRARTIGPDAFYFFALAAALSGAYYLPNFLAGISGHRSDTAAVFLPSLPPALLAVGLLRWPASEALPRGRMRTLLDGLLVAVSFFLLAWGLADRVQLPLTILAPRWLAILPLSTTMALLVVWAIQESRMLSVGTGRALMLIRGAIGLIAAHHFLSTLLHAEGGYQGWIAQGTETLNQGAILLLGLASLSKEKTGNEIQASRPTERWRLLVPALTAALALTLSILLLFSTADPRRRAYWALGLFLVILLLLRQQLLVLDLADLSRSLERKVAARTRQLEMEHEELLRAQRMQLMAGLAAGLAHDLNGLLGALGLRLDLMRQTAPSSGTLLPHFESMEEILDRASSMTRRILSSRESNSARPESFDLPAWMRAHRDLFQSLLAPGQHLDMEADGQAPVHVDPDHLAQVVQNLITNARDAMGGGGHVALRVQPESGAEAIRIIVEDTGTGIDPANLRRIFDPFFTTKPSGKGTGLGLSTVRGLVVQNRGRIQVESESGRGTRFIVDLPAGPD